MGLYEFAPSIGNPVLVKGGFLPEGRSPSVWVPRPLSPPRDHLSFLRQHSVGDLHNTFNRAVEVGIIETQNLDPAQREVWTAQGKEWLAEQIAQSGVEGFELHIDPDLNHDAKEQARNMGLRHDEFILLTTRPVQIYSLRFTLVLLQ